MYLHTFSVSVFFLHLREILGTLKPWVNHWFAFPVVKYILGRSLEQAINLIPTYIIPQVFGNWNLRPTFSHHKNHITPLNVLLGEAAYHVQHVDQEKRSRKKKKKCKKNKKNKKNLKPEITAAVNLKYLFFIQWDELVTDTGWLSGRWPHLSGY